ncbi:hypothetical protein, partial [Aquabacterium sp.]|uniref:hypothetical protein n=1 Tax=Aquabacterium sp. TaxID=1872578 RepID=UPI0025C2E038
PTYEGGVVHVHPAQLQIAAQLIGFTVPDKTRAALARVASRLKALKAQVNALESRLRYATHEKDLGMGPELVSAEHIGFNLGELVKDLEDLTLPEVEAIPDAPANPGGQLALV